MFSVHALDAAHREHALEAAKSAWLRLRPVEPEPVSIGIAPNVRKVADPLRVTADDHDRNQRRALELLQSHAAPMTRAELAEQGVRNPAQTIYELQLAGYRIDRLATGYALWPDERGAAEPPPAAPSLDAACAPPTPSAAGPESPEDGLGHA